MKNKQIFLSALVMSTFLSTGMFLGGCGGGKKGLPQQTLQVSVYKPFQSDTLVTQEYAGTVMAMQKVPIRANVSGAVVEKFVEGGAYVSAGDALYRIDTRNYASALAAAKAKSLQALATYENAKKDLDRFGQLIESGAISQKVYDGQKTATETYRAAYEAAQSQVELAGNSMADTVVKAPFSGTLSTDDIPVGTFVAAGQTLLVTLSSSNPIFVQFQMSEKEYLHWSATGGRQGDQLKLCLADGTMYGELGEIVQINSGLTGGQMTVKAAFPNPNNLLIPGMYAKIVSDTQYKKGSLLIPTKAIIQLLNKDMVDVVVDGKVQQKHITISGQHGIYTIVESGLSLDDVIIVEGQHKVRAGQEVETKELTKDELEEVTQKTEE